MVDEHIKYSKHANMICNNFQGIATYIGLYISQIY